MKLAEFFVDLAVKADTITVSNLIHKFGELRAITLAQGYSLQQLASGFADIANETFNTAAGLGVFEATTGASTLELQKWQRVAEQVGGTAGGVTSSISRLSAAQAAYRLTGDQALFRPSMLLGMDLTKMDPFEILRKLILQGGLRKLDPAMRASVLNMLGIDTSLLAIRSEADFSRMAAAATGLTRKEIELGREGKAALMQLSQAATMTKDNLVVTFGPAYIKVLQIAAKELASVRGQTVAMATAVSAVLVALIPIIPLLAIGAVMIAAWTKAIKEFKEHFNEIRDGLKSLKEEGPRAFGLLAQAAGPEATNPWDIFKTSIWSALRPVTIPYAAASAGLEAAGMGPVNVYVNSTAPAADLATEIQRVLGGMLHKTVVQRDNRGSPPQAAR